MGPGDSDKNIPTTTVDSGDRARELVRNVMAADTFSVVNGYATAQAIFAFSKSPMLQSMRDDGCVKPERVAEQHGLHPRHAVGLMHFLTTQNLFREEDGTFYPTPKGEAALSQAALGWLTMIRGGYGNLMEQAEGLLTKELTYDQDIARDGYWTAVGSCMVTGAILDSVPYKIAEDKGWRCIGDLGCGAGQFLIEFARRHPEHRGVGIDIDRDAIEQAKANAKAAGVDDRVSFVVGNAFELEAVASECKEVEVFYSFGFEHEHFRDGEEAVIKHIDGIGELFPGSNYLVGEPMVSRTVSDGQFYWVHILSHQGIPKNVAGWSKVLGKLKKGRLEGIYIPDHRMIGAFFNVRF